MGPDTGEGQGSRSSRWRRVTSISGADKLALGEHYAPPPLLVQELQNLRTDGQNTCPVAQLRLQEGCFTALTAAETA